MISKKDILVLVTLLAVFVGSWLWSESLASMPYDTKCEKVKYLQQTSPFRRTAIGSEIVPCQEKSVRDLRAWVDFLFVLSGVVTSWGAFGVYMNLEKLIPNTTTRNAIAICGGLILIIVGIKVYQVYEYVRLINPWIDMPRYPGWEIYEPVICFGPAIFLTLFGILELWTIMSRRARNR